VYGHLKFKNHPLWIVILASWGIAFFEYVLQVPANRLGDDQYTVTQLKVMQEAITLLVFVGFAWAYFDVTPTGAPAWPCCSCWRPWPSSRAKRGEFSRRVLDGWEAPRCAASCMPPEAELGTGIGNSCRSRSA